VDKRKENESEKKSEEFGKKSEAMGVDAKLMFDVMGDRGIIGRRDGSEIVEVGNGENEFNEESEEEGEKKEAGKSKKRKLHWRGSQNNQCVVSKCHRMGCDF
jgi:hypothetical protein